MEIRIKKIDIAIYALFLGLFKIYILPDMLQIGVRLAMLLCCAIFVFTHIKKKYLFNFTIVMMMSFLLSTICGYISGTVNEQSIYNGLLHGLCLYLTYVLFRYCSETGYFWGTVKCLFNVTSLAIVCSLISMVVKGSSSSYAINYAFGSKFMTSYLFLFWMILLWTKRKEGNIYVGKQSVRSGSV